MGTYAGALVRAAQAHYGARVPVPGVSPTHEHPIESGDIFNPVPLAPKGQAGDIWAQDLEATAPGVDPGPVSHWDGAPALPVPSNVHSWQAIEAERARMVGNHMVEAPHLDAYVPYLNGDQGRVIEYLDGRTPIQEGEQISDDLQYLVAGKNSFDFTNHTNEVYSAEDSGRRRLGTEIRLFGRYQFWTQQGQDAELRAYTGLQPAFPVDKPSVVEGAPYTPNSSGTATWVQPTYQDVSTFGLPAETVMTDYTVRSTGEQDYSGASEFGDGERM